MQYQLLPAGVSGTCNMTLFTWILTTGALSTYFQWSAFWRSLGYNCSSLSYSLLNLTTFTAAKATCNSSDCAFLLIKVRQATGGTHYLCFVVYDTKTICRHPQHSSHRLLPSLENTRQGWNKLRNKETFSVFPHASRLLPFVLFPGTFS